MFLNFFKFKHFLKFLDDAINDPKLILQVEHDAKSSQNDRESVPEKERIKLATPGTSGGSPKQKPTPPPRSSKIVPPPVPPKKPQVFFVCFNVYFFLILKIPRKIFSVFEFRRSFRK